MKEVAGLTVQPWIKRAWSDPLDNRTGRYAPPPTSRES